MTGKRKPDFYGVRATRTTTGRGQVTKVVISGYLYIIVHTCTSSMAFFAYCSVFWRGKKLTG
jgi:hypothetical protein